MAILPGSRLGHYEILYGIRAGGLGEVYQAYNAKLGRDIAIKALSEVFARDTERLSPFQRESKKLAALNHPNIAAIHGWGHSDGVDFLIVGLASGGPQRSSMRKDFL